MNYTISVSYKQLGRPTHGDHNTDVTVEFVYPNKRDGCLTEHRECEIVDALCQRDSKMHMWYGVKRGDITEDGEKRTSAYIVNYGFDSGD